MYLESKRYRVERFDWELIIWIWPGCNREALQSDSLQNATCPWIQSVWKTQIPQGIYTDKGQSALWSRRPLYVEQRLKKKKSQSHERYGHIPENPQKGAELSQKIKSNYLFIASKSSLGFRNGTYFYCKAMWWEGHLSLALFLFNSISIVWCWYEK